MSHNMLDKIQGTKSTHSKEPLNELDRYLKADVEPDIKDPILLPIGMT